MFLVRLIHIPKLAFREDVDSLISSLIQGPYQLESVHHASGPSPSWFVHLESKIDQETLVQVGKTFFAGRMIRFLASSGKHLASVRSHGL